MCVCLSNNETKVRKIADNLAVWDFCINTHTHTHTILSILYGIAIKAREAIAVELGPQLPLRLNALCIGLKRNLKIKNL